MVLVSESVGLRWGKLRSGMGGEREPHTPGTVFPSDHHLHPHDSSVHPPGFGSSHHRGIWHLNPTKKKLNQLPSLIKNSRFLIKLSLIKWRPRGSVDVLIRPWGLGAAEWSIAGCWLLAAGGRIDGLFAHRSWPYDRKHGG